MKASEVVVGKIYAAKVSGRIVPVRIESKSGFPSYWYGVNLETGRGIRIRSPRRLRYEIEQKGEK